MAASLEKVSQTKKKRKRKHISKKLLVGENVEVRRTEEGFHGSWHSATVIECNDLIRRVRYKHLLDDNGIDFIVESIPVSPMVDGVVPINGIPVNYRGLIRPLPPPFKFDRWGLSYGLCVDAYVGDAWWEGVIFDNKDGSEERLVFFPDLGDECTVKLEHLRITHDWAEVTEKWVMREDWLFLEVVEEQEKEQFVCVSKKQLWYDLRVKEAFRVNITEWTCWVRPLWDSLVREVIHDNVNLTAMHFLTAIQSLSEEKFVDGPSKRSKPDTAVQFEGILQDHIEENQSVCSLGPRTSSSRYKNKSGFMLPPEDVLHDNVEETQLSLTSQKEKIPKRQADSCNILEETNKIKGSFEFNLHSPVEKGATLKFRIYTDSNGRALRVKGNMGASSIEGNNDNLDPPDDLREDGDCDPKAFTVREVQVDPPCTSAQLDTNRFTQSSSVTDDRGELREDMLLLYLDRSLEKSCHKELGTVIKKHLMSVGWKINHFKDAQNVPRIYYIPPLGKIHCSLPQVCRYLIEDSRTRSTRNVNKVLADMPPMMSPGSSMKQVSFLDTFQQHCGTDSCGGTSLGKAIALNELERETGGKSNVLSLPTSLSLNSLKKKRALVDAEFVQEYCPQAVAELYRLGARPKNVNGLSELRLKARKHLLAMGWTCRDIGKNGGRERRYTSPSPHCRDFNSLRTACKECIDQGLSNSTRLTERIIKGKESKAQWSCGNLSPEIVSAENEEYQLHNTRYKSSSVEVPVLSESKEIQPANIEAKRIRGRRKRGEDNSWPSASMPIPSNVNASSSDSSEKRISLVSTSAKTQGQTMYQSISYQKQKKRKTVTPGSRKRDNLKIRATSCVQRSNKRARQVGPPNPAHYTPQTILTWLIDNNVLLPRDKVFCKRRNQLPLEGKITRDGIKCNCCQKVFGISGFHVHAGSTKRRPASSIILEDGRSLLACQKQFLKASELKDFKSVSYQRIKSSSPQVKNDSICSVCHYGGILVLCDKCPSAFHLPCIGLESLPIGKWFCPSCQCGICGQSEFSENINQVTDKTVLNCDQCEREYHVGCLRRRTMAKLYCRKGIWFCSKICEKIYMGLHKILGKPIAVSEDNLSWTILKSSEDSDKDAIIAHSKLNVALSVMHECFEPIKEPQTKDLVKDVLFNKRSTLKRLDFRGFYTVVLEREDELISVATVRVYGGKVAEIPLVGTRVQYRRQGMCRILMNILEQKLTELGVERLFLPAIPQLLQAWTTSFGFTEMTNSERLVFLEYTFLDFQGTTMCQKFLQAEDKLNLIDVSSPQAANNPDILQEVSVKGAPRDDCSSTEMVSPLAMSTDMMWKNYDEKGAEENGDKEADIPHHYQRRTRTPISFCGETLLLTNGKSSESAFSE